jgi:hypothetical protein
MGVKTEITQEELIQKIRDFRDVEANSTSEFSIVKRVLQIEKSISQDLGMQKSVIKNDPSVEFSQQIKPGEFGLREREIAVFLWFMGTKYDRIIFVPNRIQFVYRIKIK